MCTEAYFFILISLVMMSTAICVRNTFLSFGTEHAKLRRTSSDSILDRRADWKEPEIPKRELDHKVFIGGLSCNTDEMSLFAFMTRFGSVKNVTVKRNPVTGQSRRYAFVKFYQAPYKGIFEGPWTLQDHVIRVTKYQVSSSWKNHYYSDEEERG